MMTQPRNNDSKEYFDELVGIHYQLMKEWWKMRDKIQDQEGKYYPKIKPTIEDYQEAIEDLSDFALGINQEISNISLGMAIEALEEKLRRDFFAM